MDNEDGLGRRYFQNLLSEDQEWKQELDDVTGEYHWISGATPSENGFALTCDMALVRNITHDAVDLSTGQVSEDWGDLIPTRQGFHGMVRRYANGDTNWSKTFANHIRDVYNPDIDSTLPSIRPLSTPTFIFRNAVAYTIYNYIITYIIN